MFASVSPDSVFSVMFPCLSNFIRSCYDLEMHSKRTGVPMMASCQLDEPRVVTVYKLQADRKALGVTFKGDQKKVLCRCYLLDYNDSFYMSNFDRGSSLILCSGARFVFCIRNGI